MSLVRAIPLKNFLDTALSTSDASAAGSYSTQAPTAGQKLYGALHLTAVSTGRTLQFRVQSASSSGFGTATTELSFALSTERGSTWLSLASPSTDRVWRRAIWTLSTASSTGGSWNGLAWIAFK